MEYLYPFKDKNLIEFCVNLPIEYKIREGYNRYTIRKGLENILPPLIQSRNTKMPLSPDYMRRYKKQIPFVLTFLEEIKHPEDDQLFDVFVVEKKTEIIAEDIPLAK